MKGKIQLVQYSRRIDEWSRRCFKFASRNHYEFFRSHPLPTTSGKAAASVTDVRYRLPRPMYTSSGVARYDPFAHVTTVRGCCSVHVRQLPPLRENRRWSSSSSSSVRDCYLHVLFIDSVGGQRKTGSRTATAAGSTSYYFRNLI